MKEILLTSSALIVVLLAVRLLFRNTISRRVQYALWGLVLVRLLLPFQLPAMEHNVLTAAAPVQQSISANLERQTVYVPVAREPLADHPTAPDTGPAQAISPTAQKVWVVESSETAVQYRKLTGEELLQILWFGGMAAMACWLLLSNLLFWRRLHGRRVFYPVSDCKYPVYLVEEGLPSPCLFGLIRPAIYLTPAAVENTEKLRHVLAHETTHARHLDPVWSLLRGICLVVYWFDPLVWAAAFASRTDCELACDEGALNLLGESERISYGRTLLSLIPVRKGPASPLLSATTMTADKKRLMDRIKRIAENRQTVQAAIFAVVAISLMVCLMTFTGAKTPTPLTNAELSWFNTEFFNGEDLNIRNQFLSSTYQRPEEINMYELFYCGTCGEDGHTAPMTQEERILLLNTFYDGFDPDCDCIKIPAAEIDAVLMEHTGLTLADTQALGMGGFDYLAKYDAYYLYHGDTNYRSRAVIAAGERKGDLVRLYYDDRFMGDGWKCVTLRNVEGGYHFVSNLPAQQPENISNTQVILPAGEPDARIKLDDLTVYGPQEVSCTEANGAAVRQALGSAEASQITIGPYTVVCWTDNGGVTHFSYGRTDGNIGEAAFYDFLVCPALEGEYTYEVELFYNLLGRSGFMVSYTGGEDLEPKVPTTPASSVYTVHRYYDFNGSALQLLATTVGGGDIRTNLDGDSITELYFDPNFLRSSEGIPTFFFAGKDRIYGVNLNEIAKEAYPDWNDSFSFRDPDAERDHLILCGFYRRADSTYVDAFRNVYFTGDEFLFYRDGRKTADHVAGTPDVPGEILQIAKNEVERLYNLDAQEQANLPDPSYDDWRIENLLLAKTYSFINGNIEVYNMNYEFHAGKPANVMLAGGMYLTEEDWVMPNYPNCWYLCFANESGVRRHLRTFLSNDGTPGTENFDTDVRNLAMAEGLTTMADLEGRELLSGLASNTVGFLEDLGKLTPEEQDRVASKICYFRTSGPEEDQLLYQDTMQALVQWNTYELTAAQYGTWSLLFNYHVCQPAELTDEERYGALEAAERHMRKFGNSEACLSFRLSDVSIDSYETWRIVNMYTDSEIAVRNGYNHDTMTHLTAVRAVYDVQWDPTKSPADEEGRSARYLYMLPGENGEWFVWNSILTGAPELYDMTLESLSSDANVILQMNNSGYITQQDDYWRLRVESCATDLTWTGIENAAKPAGDFLTIGNTEMGVFLRCWEQSDLVQMVFLDEEAWYKTAPLYADAVFDGRLFTMMRPWYDQVEWSALVGGIVIPDRGQSQLEVAQEWTDRYIQTALRVTPGSEYACTYVRAEASIWDWVPETAYPASTDGKDRFYFGYIRVFVPETEKALQYQMAGNTVEYDGSMGTAPEGAYMNSQVGPMYLTEEGWRCDGTGTGI